MVVVVVVFQLYKLGDSLQPINASLMTSISVQLVNATRVRHKGSQPIAMSAADLSASVAVIMRTARIYSSRRRSLILHQSVMNVSLHNDSLYISTARYFDLLLTFFLEFVNDK